MNSQCLSKQRAIAFQPKSKEWTFNVFRPERIGRCRRRSSRYVNAINDAECADSRDIGLLMKRRRVTWSWSHEARTRRRAAGGGGGAAVFHTPDSVLSCLTYDTGVPPTHSRLPWPARPSVRFLLVLLLCKTMKENARRAAIFNPRVRGKKLCMLVQGVSKIVVENETCKMTETY